MIRLFPYIAISLLMGMYVFAAETAFGQSYQTPPEAMKKLVDAPQTPGLSISPDEKLFVLMERPSHPSIEDLAADELRLAGLRLNPNNFGPSRSSHYTGLSIHSFEEDHIITVTGLPDSPRIRNIRWAPDSKHLALTVDLNDAIYVYVVSASEGSATLIQDVQVNDVYWNFPISWLSNSKQLIIRSVPSNAGPPPSAPLRPNGPIVQENLGEEAPARTYQDLLKNEHDEALFEYYVTSRLVLVDLDGSSATLSDDILITRATPSPSGEYILLETLHKPFSYLVPASRFPRKTEIIDTSGRVVTEIADLPLAENIPTAFGSVRDGIRNVNWRGDQDASIYWVEARDGGDARAEAEYRDELFTLDAPFDEDPRSIAKLPLRYRSISWSSGSVAIVSERWFSTRQRRIYSLDLDDKQPELSLLFDLSTEDRYSDPGNLVYTRNEQGRQVLLTSDNNQSVFLSGPGASPEGNVPFLRKLDVKSGETQTLFQSEAPYYEYPVYVFSGNKNHILTRRESPDEPPNYFKRDLDSKALISITEFPHPYPEFSEIQKELLIYERADGVKLNATLYTPSGYDSDRDGPLPTLLWAYPIEYKNASNAGQISDSPYRFKSLSYWGALPYVTQGYAVLDRTSMPVIGEEDEEPNDTFVQQLVMNAEAAIKAGELSGAVDPQRVAIGGHSYGAFMTANLLAHSDLFRAGIARSGAYNRSLTPFGFQREERTFWEAPEIYFAMSPFMHADKVNEPLLLIHGEADNNSGTFPMQSSRFYNALKGHGKVARLVFLPYESHGYRARESILHMLWETHNWLDQYVKPQADIVDPVGE